jgi:hypothetical protein
MSLHKRIEESIAQGGEIDAPCKTYIQKLANAANFADRAILLDENLLLFEQNNEKTTRKSIKAAVVGDVGYEIDKQRALFIAGGANPTEYFLEQEGNQLPSFTQDMRNQCKWTEATETVRFDEEVSGISCGYTSKGLMK